MHGACTHVCFKWSPLASVHSSISCKIEEFGDGMTGCHGLHSNQCQDNHEQFISISKLSTTATNMLKWLANIRWVTPSKPNSNLVYSLSWSALKHVIDMGIYIIFIYVWAEFHQCRTHYSMVPSNTTQISVKSTFPVRPFFANNSTFIQ